MREKLEGSPEIFSNSIYAESRTIYDLYEIKNDRCNESSQRFNVVTSSLRNIGRGKGLSAYQTCSQGKHVLFRDPKIGTLDPNRVCPSYHGAYHKLALDAHMLHACVRDTYTHTGSHIHRSWLKGVCAHGTRCGDVARCAPFGIILKRLNSQIWFF